MEYSALVDVYEALDGTSSRLDKTEILADLFTGVDEEQLEEVVRLCRGKVFANWESEKLNVSSSLTVEAIAKATGISEEQIEEWWREEGDIGSGAARACENKTQQTLFSESLTVETVYDSIQEIATYEGEGSQQRRVNAVAGLLTDAQPREARYIVRTIAGAMRFGVGEGLIRDAIAWAFLDDTDDSIRAVERAYEVTNDAAFVAKTARDEGKQGLDKLDIKVFRPIKPMLAQSGETFEQALLDLGDDGGEVLVESKYDGIRAKLHGHGEELRMFTRRLEDVTEQFPDVMDAVADGIDANSFIIEAEVVGLNPDTGDVVPFQTLSKRIKRKYDIEETVEKIPVTVYLFDCLYLDGDSLLESPLRARLDRLENRVDSQHDTLERADHLQTDTVEAAESFYQESLAAGHEGTMVKNLDAMYQPGSRVGFQLKMKPTMEPLDLVVTRAKWSEGRKSEYLGRPYLACYDENTGELREVGRMHTGFTDAQLEEFHEMVEPLITNIEGREAQLEPEVVLEVEYEEIQESPKYDSGYALRFPRLSGIRSDLSPADADSFDRVKSLYEQQT